jgi:hypothetical protein
MTTENNGWLANSHNQLVATIPIPNQESAENVLTQYQSFLQRWQTLIHPNILEIDESQMSLKELNGQKVLTTSIFSKKLSQFEPSKTMISSLSTVEKLFIVKQTIALDIYVRQNDLNGSWEMSRLYLHQSGCCGWLPPLPIDSQETHHSQERMIHFLLTLFDFGEVADWRDLEKAGQIPWEWGVFIENDWANDKDLEQFDIFKVFSFIFFQSWLYTTANRLGMKDKVLSKKEYDILYQFGISLGLDDEQIQQLNIIAQQQHPNWKDLMAIVDNNN